MRIIPGKNTTFTRKSIYKPLQNPNSYRKTGLLMLGWIMIGILLWTGGVQTFLVRGRNQINPSSTPLVEEKIINTMIVGYGGKGHDGGYLADSIAVASYHPTHHTMTMISIPRDLIVRNASGSNSKINAIMAATYNRTLDIHVAARSLRDVVSEVIGLSIDHYAMVDFTGFEELIDSVGGIEVYVPSHFLDMQYPVDRSGEYEIFELPQGQNQLSGPNTLRYARSRHSTSDFSRSRRQQTIIQAFFNKLISAESLSVSRIRSLYNSYQKLIVTDISLNTILGFVQYSTTIPKIQSFGLTIECINESWRTMIPGCVLREASGGLLPAQAKAGEIESYRGLHQFVSLVTKYPMIAEEQVPLFIYNASDPESSLTRPFGQYQAFKNAVKLARFGFNIQDVQNAPEVSTGTILQIYGSGSSDATIAGLQLFYPIDEVVFMTGQHNEYGYLMEDGIHLYLGDDYLSDTAQHPFEYYEW